MFKLKSPSKYSLFDAIHLLRHSFYWSKQFLNSSNLIPFGASAVFCFISSMSAKYFPLRTFFIQENKQTKKSLKVRLLDQANRVGHRTHAIFGQKLMNTQCGVSRWSHKSPIMKWGNVLSFFKKSL